MIDHTPTQGETTDTTTDDPGVIPFTPQQVTIEAPQAEPPGPLVEPEQYITAHELAQDPVKFGAVYRELMLETAANQVETHKLLRAAAEHGLEKAQAEKDTAIKDRTKADEELLRIRSNNRPCIALGCYIGPQDGRWTATYAGVQASGDTPDQAMDNFDFRWMNG